MSLKVSETSPFEAGGVSFSYSPLEYLRTTFVLFFQGLFKEAPPGMYHWEQDDGLSEIYISDENPVKAEMIGKRPSISFTRGPVRFYSLGLDDMLDYNFATGAKKKSVLVPGTFIINASSRVPLESERIAWICAEQLWLLRELLMKNGFFEIGRSPEIGSPSPSGSIVVSDNGDEWYTTSVSCPFQLPRTGEVTPLGQRVVANVAVALQQRTLAVQDQYKRFGGHCGPTSTERADLPYGVKHCPPSPFAPLASDANGNTARPGRGPVILPHVPHPLNPAQTVTVRAAKPNCPAVRPPSMGGRAIPLTRVRVEDSCAVLTDEFPAETRTFKV